MELDEAVKQIDWYMYEDDGIAAEKVTKEAYEMVKTCALNYLDFVNLVTDGGFKSPPSFEVAKAHFIGRWKSGPKVGWIPVSDRLPPEHDTIFAKLKGTAQWKPGMFATQSEDVRVVFRFEDGTRKVGHNHTIDGVWDCEKPNRYPKRTVTHWCENPPLPEEEA